MEEQSGLDREKCFRKIWPTDQKRIDIKQNDTGCRLGIRDLAHTPTVLVEMGSRHIVVLKSTGCLPGLDLSSWWPRRVHSVSGAVPIEGSLG